MKNIVIKKYWLIMQIKMKITLCVFVRNAIIKSKEELPGEAVENLGGKNQWEK